MADLLYVHDGGANDAAVVTLLETEHTVTQHDVNGGVDPIPGDAGDYDCIVLGDALGSGEIGTSYRDLAVPVVAPASSSSWGSPLELTSSLSSNGSSTTIVVTDDAHEIAVAAGLANGTQTIADSSHPIYRADGLGPEADSIAYHFQSTRHTFFAYESGAEMANSVLAPARRVALGFIVAADTLTALGDACLLESVTWAIGAAAGGDEAITASLSSSFSLSASILENIEALVATLSAAFSASADNFTIYISKFVSLVTSFAASASAGSLPAAISATLAWSSSLAATAQTTLSVMISGAIGWTTSLSVSGASLVQRIATASLRTTFSLLGSASGVSSSIVSGATDIVVSSVNFIRTGATFITGSMRNIFRKD
jgi:hypothetical protein